MEPKDKLPVAMTIHEMIRRLTVVMEEATPEEKQALKRAWLDPIPRFNAETERMRQERLRKCSNEALRRS